SKALVDKDIPDDKKNIAIALITLDMLSTPERSNTTSKTISGVSISYSTGASTSKWRKMYEDMLNGMITSDISIYYVGI
ncbi:MAG: hypothetical protein ACRCX2_06955, partial [Paraclostridium sp.]